MIEVLNPGFMSIIVDGGRHGHADIGVPPSSALDRFAYLSLLHLLGNHENAPAVEIMGSDFRIRFGEDMLFALTGARVRAFLDDDPLLPWTSTMARKGSVLRVQEVKEGLRYYLGFSGTIEADEIMGSCTTNIECRFGGFGGRPLMKADRIMVRDIVTDIEERAFPDEMVPLMGPPHIIRMVQGPEWEKFEPGSTKDLQENGCGISYRVSPNLNRTGIRFEGQSFIFKDDVEKSIISEGILPGTIQIPGDGLPIIGLAERTIGGYARIGTVAMVDMDRLAHLRPRDTVHLRTVPIGEAERLWKAKRDSISFLYKKQ